ncbi:MAG: xanthine dehydrogenase family protein molybdopterin-binding subunit [Pseudomonadota bacterium]
MSKFATSQPVRRVEDERFVTGNGRYIDDITMPGTLRAHFLRAPVGHARIAAIDIAAAAALPGVHLVLTGADLDAALVNDLDAAQLTNRDGTASVRPRRPIMPPDRVRHVGEAVACIVADSLTIAKDAAELIEVEYDVLDAVVDTPAALQPGQPTVHDDAPGNLCFDWALGDEAAADAGLAAAVKTVELELVNNRVVANPMETRGCLAHWDGTRLTMHYNGQGVWDMKGDLAKHLRLAEDAIRVLTPDVGGGFGIKAFNYPEHYCVGHAARVLGRPVKWIGERTESIMADCMGRDHVTRMVAGFDAAHRITGLRIEVINNLGAYCSPFGTLMASELASRVLTGVYDLQAVWYGVKGCFTNTTPVDAYRGAGRPEAQYQIERLMDKAARVLGVDPLELRRINFIKPQQFPYETPAGETYDVGDFDRVMRTAIAKTDWHGFEARRRESLARGKYRGRGLCYYIESILGAQDEHAEIALADDGTVELMVGTQSAGQGHETVFAQFLHERTGIPFEQIRVVQGDSDRIATGGGTGGSRSVTMQGTAVFGAADDLIAAMRPLAEEELEAAAADLEFTDGAWRVAGTDRAVDLIALAAKARREGRVEFLSQRTRTEVPGRSFPNGCHIAEVEVDPDTGRTEVVRYGVVDDFGRLMNPMLAEGQVHGGVAQGIGQALCEHVVYDSDGQLLSASFMDYAMPRAADVPLVPFHHEGVPSTANAIGMKGCGEAGTVGACAAVINALLDALWDRGVQQVDMPATPLRVWGWMNDVSMAAE